MRLVLALLTLATLLVHGGGLQAAQFTPVEMPDGHGMGILLTGVIQPDDELAFEVVAAKLSRAVVITTGPGGSVGPALAIGSEIRERGWSTLVPSGGSCASACAMIWLAGQTRMLGAGGQIGFHAMALIQGLQRTETHEFDVYLRSWLTNLGYAMDTTATIVNTHAASIRWYDAIELRANGIPTEDYPPR
jgi:hypothetical protein